MFNLMRQCYKYVPKVKVDFWPFSQGRSYWSPINILKHSFLRNHKANWTQISYESKKEGKIKNQYNQVPHLTQDTNGKETTHN